MKYLFNVDYLEFCASTNIQLNNFQDGGIYKFYNGLILNRIKNLDKLKHYYSYGFQIFYKGEALGFLYTKTIDLSLSTDLNTMVRIDNKIFYTKSINSINKLIIEALELTRIKISRLDVCYDTNFDVLSIFKNFYYDSSIKFRYREKIIVEGTGRDDKTIKIGSFISRVKSMSIYNKTIELRRKEKEYIRNTHKEIFGNSKDIYRVEIKIMSRTIEIKDIDIMNLDDENYLELIFNTYFENLIYFSDIITGEKIEFITINNSAQKLPLRAKQKIKCGGKHVKTIINFLDQEINTKEFKGLIRLWKQIRSVILKKYGLETWHQSKK